MPVTPADVNQRIPEEVFCIFDAFLFKKWNKRESSAKILHKYVCDALHAVGITDEEIEAGKYLNVEPHYERLGWKVSYSQPDHYTSNFDSYFLFEKGVNVCA